MQGILELLARAFFTAVVYPLALEIATRREIDPEFKKASDDAYGAVKSAATSADKKAAARKLYELQKKPQTS